MIRGILYIFAFVTFMTLSAGATTYLVPDQFKKIQAAIDYAQSGDRILVKEGTYHELIDFKGKDILIRSAHGPLRTVLDGDQWGPVVTFGSAETENAVLRGFTVTNGDSSKGGGVSCIGTSPTITDCIFTKGSGSKGAGIYMYQAAPRIERNVFRENRGHNGGAIYAFDSQGTIDGNLIENNESWGSGAGIYVENSRIAITNNIIRDNTDKSGIYVDESTVTISGNIITNNDGTQGGGIRLGIRSDAIIVNNVISGNSCMMCGGGIYLNAPPVEFAFNTVTDNWADDYGAGVFVYVHGPCSFSNSIFYGNASPLGHDDLYLYVGSPVVTYCNVRGGYTGTGNIDADPLFAPGAAGDYHLTFDSPCRDTGNSLLVPSLPAEDCEGDPRVAGSEVDMGADEFYPHLYHGGTVASGQEIVFRAIGIPGSGSTLLHGPGRQNPPLLTPFGELHLRWPVTIYNKGTFPANGYDEIRYTLPNGLPRGKRLHYQMLTGGRLRNLMILEVE